MLITKELNKRLSNYLKLFINRSRFINGSLLIGDLESYEIPLVEELEIYFNQIIENRSDSVENARKKYSEEFYEWSETNGAPVEFLKRLIHLLDQSIANATKSLC